MYSTGRMLRDLALSGQAPGLLTRLNGSRSPGFAITASTLLMGLGVLLNYVAPGKAFVYITSVATVCGLWTWAMILVCQIRYRRAWQGGRLPAPTFRAPGGLWSSWGALTFLAVVLVLIAFDSNSRISLYVFPVWAVLLVVGYRVLRRTGPQAVPGAAHDQPTARIGG